jgi:hypothetical protein
MLKSGAFICLSLSILFASFSCIDESAKNIDSEVYFSPSYSLPIGQIQIVPEDIVGSNYFQNIDTSVVSDTISYFWYDSAFYEAGPGYYDTIVSRAFDFSTISDRLDATTSLMIRLNVINDFPTEMFVQLYFNDGNNNVLDSLFDSGYVRIDPAPVDNQGNITGPSLLRNYDTYLDRSEIDMLTQVRNLNIYIRVGIINNNIEFVKLYPNYKIDLNLAFRIGLNMNLGDI